jgi:hypothetical protein
VTSGGIRCSKGTPIIKKSKKSNPSLFIKGGTMGKKKTKVLTLNKYMAMGPSGARCQEWPCWLVAGGKLLLCCSALLVLYVEVSWCAFVGRQDVTLCMWKVTECYSTPYVNVFWRSTWYGWYFLLLFSCIRKFWIIYLNCWDEQMKWKGVWGKRL